MESRIGSLILIASMLLLAPFTMAQNHHGHAHYLPNPNRDQFIEDFCQLNNISEAEKQSIKCEFSVLYNQFEDKNKLGSGELTKAFKSVLATYRTTKKIDYSQRLFQPREVSRSEMRKIINARNASLNWKAVPQDVLDEYNATHGGYTRAAECDNIDFEFGNFTDWTLEYASGGGAANLNPGADLGGNHMITSGTGTDPNTGGNIPVVYPGGGAHSMRLGNGSTSGYGAARASYTFQVTPQSTMFYYRYAVVLQDPNHPPSAQPYLDIKVKVGGNWEPCGKYYQVADASDPDYSTNGNISYKNWSEVSLNFNSVQGQFVTVIFTTVDCSYSGHYGYAYIDAECAPLPGIEPVVMNCLNPTPVLQGPEGENNTYLWENQLPGSPNKGIIGVNNADSLVVNENGKYKLTVTPTTGSACAYELFTEVIDSMGSVSIDYTATPQALCIGKDIAFQNSISIQDYGGNPDSTLWIFGDGDTTFNTSQTNHNYVNPGTYDVTLLVITDKGCSDTVTKQVIIHPDPVADYTFDSVCAGTNLTVLDLSTINTINNNSITSWDWSLGDGQQATGQNPTINYPTEGKYNLTLAIESNNGCQDTIVKEVLIYPNPVVDFDPSEVCFGETTVFTDLSTVSNAHSSNNITNWSWDFADGSVDSVQNTSHQYQSDGLFNVTLTVISNNGCVGTKTIPVRVNPLPVAGFAALDSAACPVFCPEIYSTSTVNAPSSIVNYEWTLSNSTEQKGADSTFNPCVDNPTGAPITYGLHLKVTTEKGCTDEYNDPYFITAYNNALADFQYSPHVAYTTNPVVSFVNTSVYADTSHWVFENITESWEENPTITFPAFPNEIDASLIAYSANGCVDTITKLVKIVVPEINYSFPNVFTPDGDGINDFFHIVYQENVQRLEIIILNRWGNVVYQDDKINFQWNGQVNNNGAACTEGTYFYKVNLTNYHGFTITEHGFIELVRSKNTAQ